MYTAFFCMFIRKIYINFVSLINMNALVANDYLYQKHFRYNYPLFFDDADVNVSLVRIKFTAHKFYSEMQKRKRNPFYVKWRTPKYIPISTHICIILYMHGKI